MRQSPKVDFLEAEHQECRRQLLYVRRYTMNDSSDDRPFSCLHNSSNIGIARRDLFQINSFVLEFSAFMHIRDLVDEQCCSAFGTNSNRRATNTCSVSSTCTRFVSDRCYSQRIALRSRSSSREGPRHHFALVYFVSH